MTSQVFQARNSALITGAALGIGRAAAIELASRGMNVALVDLPGEDLAEAVAQAREAGSGKIIELAADVSLEDSWEQIAELVLREIGTLQFLMNNAATRIGVGFDAPLEEWRQAFEVNFWGVVQGVNTFLPSMIESSDPAMIVNTGSKQGITNPPGHPIYNVAKSALKTYTEQLQHRLRNEEACQVSAHLLVPGWTTTGKREHRPGAWLPKQVIDRMIDRTSAGDFYIICPDDEVTEEMDQRRIVWGAEDITKNRPPLSRWDAGWKDEAGKACN